MPTLEFSSKTHTHTFFFPLEVHDKYVVHVPRKGSLPSRLPFFCLLCGHGLPGPPTIPPAPSLPLCQALLAPVLSLVLASRLPVQPGPSVWTPTCILPALELRVPVTSQVWGLSVDWLLPFFTLPQSASLPMSMSSVPLDVLAPKTPLTLRYYFRFILIVLNTSHEYPCTRHQLEEYGISSLVEAPVVILIIFSSESPGIITTILNFLFMLRISSYIFYMH